MHFATGAEPVTEAGLIVEFDDGRQAVSQMHDPARDFEWPLGEAADLEKTRSLSLTVHATLNFTRHEVATPLKFAVFRLGLMTVGRCCRTLVRRLLQRRLITGRHVAPICLTRRFDFLDRSATDAACGYRLRITDLIELTDDFPCVRRLSYGVDHQSAYTAAAGVYQDGVLTPWVELSDYIEALNQDRKVTIVREYPCD